MSIEALGFMTVVRVKAVLIGLPSTYLAVGSMKRTWSPGFRLSSRSVTKG